MPTYYWLYILRPADPTQPVSATNPAVVVELGAVPLHRGGLSDHVQCAIEAI